MLSSNFLHSLTANLTSSIRSVSWGTARKKKASEKSGKKVLGASHAALPTNVFCSPINWLPGTCFCNVSCRCSTLDCVTIVVRAWDLADSLDRHMEQNIFSSSLSVLFPETLAPNSCTSFSHFAQKTTPTQATCTQNSVNSARKSCSFCLGRDDNAKDTNL